MMTNAEERAAAAAKQNENKRQLERGDYILSNAQNFKTIYEKSVASLQQSSKSKAGIEGVTKPKLSEEERKKRQTQDSENRRVIRETKRSITTGRVSNWLKRYAERKEAEFNAQNATLQQTQQQNASISYTTTPNSSALDLAGNQERSIPTTQSITQTSSQEILHPWAVYSSKDSSGNTLVKIELNSRVYEGTGTYNNIAINGLNSWVAATTGYVLLSGTVLNNEITNLSIIWGDNGSTLRAEFNNNNEQTNVTIRLAYIYSVGGIWKIRQDVFGQLTAITTCYDAKPCICFIQT